MTERLFAVTAPSPDGFRRAGAVEDPPSASSEDGEAQCSCQRHASWFSRNLLFAPMAWAAFFLVFIETGLEYRAHRRGYETMLFGGPAFAASKPSPTVRQPLCGPTRRFPFRSRVIPLTKPHGVTRYWISSASYGEDIYTPVDSIFPSLMQKRAEDSGVATQVINASRAGYTIAQNISDLEELGPTWQPDFVLLYNMSTDIKALSREYLAQAHGCMPHTVEGESPPVHSGDAGVGWLNRYTERTTIYQQLKSNVTARITTQCILADGLGQQAECDFRDAILRFVRVCRRLGATPVLCTFCFSHKATNVQAMPDQYRIALLRTDEFLSISGWIATCQRYNQIIRDTAKEEQVALVDLDRRIGGRPEFFRDAVHFSREGHIEIARVLADRVIQVAESDRERSGSLNITR